MARLADRVRRILRSWLHRDRVDADLDEEITFHLEMRTRDARSEGLDGRAARRAAEQRFGDQDAVRRACFAEHGFTKQPVVHHASFGAGLGKDVSYAVRALLRRPVYSVVAVSTLALGLGANTAIFSVVDAVLLSPLPYDEPEALVRLHGFNERELSNVSPLDFLDWRAQAASYSGMTAFTTSNRFITGNARPEWLEGVLVTEAYLSTLGVDPVIGRGFVSEEFVEGNADVIILGSGLWQRRFGGDTGVLGQTVSLTGRQFTVVGVLPRDFIHPVPERLERPDFLTPLVIDESTGRGGHWLRAVARLRPDVDLATAQEELTIIGRNLETQYPETNEGWGVRAEPLHSAVVRQHRTALWILLAAVVAVLMIACVNVANLTLARATGRGREIAVRAALGGGRARIARLILTESIILSVAGGLLGLGLAYLGLRLMVATGPDDLPRLQDVSISGGVLFFTAGASLLTGILFGSAPAFRGTNLDLAGQLRDGGSSATGGRRAGRLRASLVIVETAMAVVLLIGAGLLIKSFWRLVQVDPGFKTENVLTLRMYVSETNYPSFREIGPFYDRIERELAAIPGVQAVGSVQTGPLRGGYSCNGFALDDRPDFGPDEVSCVEERVATSGYFAAMDIPVVRGRAFTSSDDLNRDRVVVINEAFAEQFWPNDDPIGRRFKWGLRDDGGTWREIVGIVGNVRHFGLMEAPRAEVYLPHAQYPVYRALTVALRTATDPTVVTPAVRQTVTAIDPDVPIYDIRTSDRLVADSVAGERFRTVLLGAFALLALSLAAVGVYGVSSYLVGERTREIGLRMALGAGMGAVLRLVLGQGVRLVAIGVVLGLLIAGAAVRVLSALLYDVAPGDPATFATAAAVLLVTALAGIYGPARRATKVPPTVALRAE